MKKTVVCSLLAAFILSGTHAFAQFKYPVYGDKNLANLDRVIQNARRNLKRTIVVNVPTNVVASGKIGLTRAVTPRNFTPVTASLIYYRQHPLFQVDVWGKEFAVLSPDNKLLKTERIVGEGFYDNASKLAADLNTFYDGKAPLLQAPNGRMVKFYALPMDGILYLPQGYSKPLVLTSNDHFVIYDVESGWGKVAENKPFVYERYKLTRWSKTLWQPKPVVEPKPKKEPLEPLRGPFSWRKSEQESASAQTQPARTFVNENLENYSSYRQALTQLCQSGQTEQWWQQEGLDKQYATGNLLGQAVVRFYNLHQADLPALLSVKQVATGKRGDIYELPVEGLKIQLKNGNIVNISPQEVVLFYPQDKVFMLIKRSQLTDGQSFELQIP